MKSMVLQIQRRLHVLFVAFVFLASALAIYAADGGAPVSSSNDSPSAHHGNSEPCPMLSAKRLRVVPSFEVKLVRYPEDWHWYYYDADGNVLREHQVELSRLGFRREPVNGPFVILFNHKTGDLFWKWAPPEPILLFNSSDEADLDRCCFGPDPLARDLWRRLKPGWNQRYLVSSRLFSDVFYGGSILTLDAIEEGLSERCAEPFAAEHERLRSKLEERKKVVEKLDAQIAAVRAKMESSGMERTVSAGWGRRESDSIRRKQSEEKRKFEEEVRKLEQSRKHAFQEMEEVSNRMEELLDDYRKALAGLPSRESIRTIRFVVSVHEEESEIP